MGREEVVEALEKEATEQEIIADRQEETNEIIEAYKDFEIEDDEDYEVVAEGLKEVKRIYKELEERRKTVSKPLLEAKRNLDSWFKPATDLLLRTERDLKRKINEYTRKKKEQSKLAMEAAAKASREGDFDAAHEASKQIVELPTASGITVTSYYDYVVEDFDQIPREFLCVDHSAVNIHIKNAGKSKPKAVPGIRFEEKSRTIARTK